MRCLRCSDVQGVHAGGAGKGGGGGNGHTAWNRAWIIDRSRQVARLIIEAAYWGWPRSECPSAVFESHPIPQSRRRFAARPSSHSTGRRPCLVESYGMRIGPSRSSRGERQRK
eukprot:scaffold50547_cov33-Tisochrysis_lutea.AAC.2